MNVDSAVGGHEVSAVTSSIPTFVNKLEGFFFFFNKDLGLCSPAPTGCYIELTVVLDYLRMSHSFFFFSGSHNNVIKAETQQS